MSAWRLFLCVSIGACVASGYAALAAQQRAVLRSGVDPTTIPYWHVKGEGWGRPAADADAAYFLSQDRDLLAVDARTGSIKWRRPTGERGKPPSGMSVLLAGSNVLAGDEVLAAFDRMTGSLKWQFNPSDGFGAGSYLGAVVDDVIYTGSPAGRVYAVDAASGVARWKTVVSNDRQTLVHEPVADKDIVVAGYGISAIPNTGGVIALDPRTGAERWRTAFPRPSNGALGSQSAGNPILVEDMVIAATAYGVIFAIDRKSGVIRWSLPKVQGLPDDYLVSSDFDFRPLARTGRLLFAGSLTGALTAYNLDTRDEAWRYPGPRYVSVAFGLSSDDRTVYVPYLGSRMVALNVNTGAERWRTETAGGGFSFPLLPMADRLYVASSASGFYALRR